MLTTHQERPREFKWYHAGPVLYGDWGTSRFYVLGLAMFFTLHASFWYVLGVCALVAAVAWAYTIVCRVYPDGGGVYSAARAKSHNLAVVGALMLFADYIITAALSAVEGMHYLGIRELAMHWGVHDPEVAERWVLFAAMGSIVLIGLINYVGAKKAGTFALFIAMGTLMLTIVLALFVVFKGKVTEGWHASHHPTGPLGHQWVSLVSVVLALSGVEAVANMTGIMVPPVEKTSKKTILPVLAEVVILNLVLALAMNALPAKYLQGGSPTQPQAVQKEQYDAAVKEYKQQNPDWAKVPAKREHVDAMPQLTHDQDDATNRILWVMSKEWVGTGFATVAGIVFGLLLISAVNTAVGGMISVQYVMSRDAELPKSFAKLNSFGVPWIALIPAVLIPIVILSITGSNLEKLADLYAIGVVGAITINLGSCTFNGKLPIQWWERGGLGVLATILAAIEGTLAYQKPHALLFAAIVVGGGLVARTTGRAYPKMKAKLLQSQLAKVPILKPAPVSVEAVPFEQMTFGTPVEQLDMTKTHVLVATRGARPLLEYAAVYAKQFNAVMMVLYVRQINVAFAGGAVKGPTFAEDADAQQAFRTAWEICQKQGVQMVPLYAVSSDVAYTILDFAATYNVQALLMGITRKASLLRALQGDTLTNVAEQLPPEIPLLIHA